jgi:hypothetical protein
MNTLKNYAAEYAQRTSKSCSLTSFFVRSASQQDSLFPALNLGSTAEEKKLDHAEEIIEEVKALGYDFVEYSINEMSWKRYIHYLVFKKATS